MEVSVNFTLLELGALKYTDHFEHKSLYLDPIKRRVKRINAKWERISRLLANPETAAYLHPVMKQLGQAYVRPRKRRNLKLTLAQKLVNRSKKSRVLPAFRPFICQRCSLSSYSLTVIKKHECRRRKYKPYSVDELERAVNFGLRSGIRNPMCALEMTDYPNNVKLFQKVKAQTISNIEKNMKKLKNAKVPSQFQTSTLPPSIKIEQKVKKKMLPCQEGSHFGTLCLQCRRSFSKFADFKSHEGCKEATSVKFLVKNFHRFPPSGIKLLVKETVNNIISMSCVNCSRTDFPNSTEFHKHIMNCF